MHLFLNINCKHTDIKAGVGMGMLECNNKKRNYRYANILI